MGEAGITSPVGGSLARGQETGQRPVLEIRGGRGGVSWKSLRELWVFRGVLAAFVVRQVKVRYKQAVVGIGWAVLQPVLAASLFALFLGRLGGIPSEGSPYLLFALAGMVAWNYFSSASGSAIDSLITDQARIRKVYFPREVLPLAAVAAAVVDFASALATLGVAAWLYGFRPSVEWLAVPLLLPLLVIFAGAVGLGLSAVNVYYRDVRYAVPFLLQLGLFASPVVYSLSAVPGAWRETYAILNPVAAAIDGLRRIVLHHEWPDLTVTAGAYGWTLVLLGLGYFCFKRLERGFSDRI